MLIGDYPDYIPDFCRLLEEGEIIGEKDFQYVGSQHSWFGVKPGVVGEKYHRRGFEEDINDNFWWFVVRVEKDKVPEKIRLIMEHREKHQAAFRYNPHDPGDRARYEEEEAKFRAWVKGVGGLTKEEYDKAVDQHRDSCQGDSKRIRGYKDLMEKRRI